MVKSGEKACKKYKTLLFRVNLNRFLTAQLEMNQNALKTITVFAVQNNDSGLETDTSSTNKNIRLNIFTD